MRIHSLQLKLSLSVTACMLTLGIALVTYAGYTARQEALDKARFRLQSTAQEHAEAIRKRLDSGMVAARTLAQALGVNTGQSRTLTRDQANAMLRDVLEKNPEFLGAYTLWEPNAFDGQDVRHIRDPQSDASGRFIPYWSRGADGRIQVDPIQQYETPGIGDFYVLPKRLKREALIEPYRYPVQGEQVLMTSLVVPILENGVFRGMAGVDLRVDFLQEIANRIRIYEGAGRVILMTHSGMIAGITGRGDAVGSLGADGEQLREYQAQFHVQGSQIFHRNNQIYSFNPITIGHATDPWAVILHVPEEVVTRDARAIVRTMTLVGAFILLCGIGLLILIQRRLVTDRIAKLSQATRALADGAFDAHCEVSGNDEIHALAVAFNDMAVKIRANVRTLEENRILLAAVLDNAFQLYGLLDLQGGLLTANKAALSLTELPLEAMVGKPFWSLPWWTHNPEDQQRLQESIAKAACGTFTRFETTHVDPQGKVHYVDFSISPLVDGQGAVQSLIVEGRDITERKRAEDALRQSEARFRSIIAVSNTGAWEFQSDTNHLWCSPEYFTMLGRDPAAFEMRGGANLGEVWLDLLHPDDLESAREHFTSYLAQGSQGMYENEFRMLHADGSWVWILSRGQTLRNPDGSLTGVTVGTHINVTEKRLAEAKERALLEQIHRSQKMDAMGQLVGGVAHDFNNMLSAIVGACQLLQEDDSERERYLGMILKASDRASGLISKLMAFSRTSSKQSTAIDLGRIMADTVAILERTLDKRIRITFEHQATIPTIIGDDSLIQNMLLNMAINASHAMPDGGSLTLGLRNTQLDEGYCAAAGPGLTPGTFVEIEIRDTGCGMSPEVQQRIFEPFFTTKAPGQGTGLGLAAAFGTVQSHHGVIHVYSEVGVGTVFRIYLPASADAVEPLEMIEAPLPGEGNILLVDDEEIIRVTAKRMLEGLGYTVRTAANGREGIEVLSHHLDDIDLVILDMIMPEMTGREAFSSMKALRPDLPIILSSGFSKEEDLQAMKAAGLAGFLHKPFRLAALSQMIQRVLAD